MSAGHANKRGFQLLPLWGSHDQVRSGLNYSLHFLEFLQLHRPIGGVTTQFSKLSEYTGRSVENRTSTQTADQIFPDADKQPPTVADLRVGKDLPHIPGICPC